MSVEQWSIAIGVATLGCAALGRWIFTVHGRLAAMDVHIKELGGKVDDLFKLHNDQRRECVSHGMEFAALKQQVINGEGE